MCAARARNAYEKAAKERQGKRNDLVENLPPSDASKARDAAGKAFGVSGKSGDQHVFLGSVDRLLTSPHLQKD